MVDRVPLIISHLEECLSQGEALDERITKPLAPYQWSLISRANLSLSFIRHFQDKLFWDQLSAHTTDEEALFEFREKIVWKRVDYRKLSLEFLSRMIEWVDVNRVIECRTDELDEDFFRTHAKEITRPIWGIIFQRKRSAEFREEFIRRAPLEARCQ